MKIVRRKINNFNYPYLPDLKAFLLSWKYLVRMENKKLNQAELINIPLNLGSFVAGIYSIIITDGEDIVLVYDPKNKGINKISRELVFFINDNYNKI